MRMHVLMIVGILIGATVVPAGAQAQTARDWEPVVFISRTGAPDEIRARLVGLDDTSVIVRLDGRQVSLPLAEVTRIQKEGDGLGNGALIGGIVLGAWCALVCGQGLPDGRQLPLAVLVNAGVGALIGTGIDALHKGRTTIYPPAPAAVPRGTARLAVSMSLRF